MALLHIKAPTHERSSFDSHKKMLKVCELKVYYVGVKKNCYKAKEVTACKLASCCRCLKA